MIFTSSGLFYSKVQFKTEQEIEKVVFDNYKLFYGEYSILLPKSKIVTSGGKGTIPDGIAIDFEKKCWYIIEVERGTHETWKHIILQISVQKAAVKNVETRTKIIAQCLSEIEKQKNLESILKEKLNISPLKLHGYIQSILEKTPMVSLPIDFASDDLREWANDPLNNVTLQCIEKYMNVETGDVIYDFPNMEERQEESLPLAKKGDVLYDIIKSGLLGVGDKVYFDYGPKGKTKIRFEGKIRVNGIEVDGIISSPSISALRCIQRISPTRSTTNGWETWKTSDGKLLEEKRTAMLKLKGSPGKADMGKNKRKKEHLAKVEDVDVFYHYAKGGTLVATMKKTGNLFVILAGSKMSLEYHFRGSGWLETRKKASISSSGELLKDVECTSPSMAAALVAGGPRDGLLFWRNKNGKKLKDLL